MRNWPQTRMVDRSWTDVHPRCAPPPLPVVDDFRTCVPGVGTVSASRVGRWPDDLETEPLVERTYLAHVRGARRHRRHEPSEL